MKITIKIALLLTMVLGLAACSKEKKIERTLLKNDGIWDVTSVHHMYYSYDSLVHDTTWHDQEAFIFHKGGMFERENSDVTGTWMNTDDDIVITLNQSAMNGSNIYVLKIIEGSKDEMILERSRKVVDMGVWTSIDTYQIKRRK